MSKQIVVPTHNLRKLPDPARISGNTTVYFFAVRVSDLPVDELSQWKDVNPRDVKTTTALYGAIKNTLSSEPTKFYLRNRGLTISAQDLVFDEKAKQVTLTLDSKALHGVIDGGHTLAACGEFLDENSADADLAYVQVKAITGLNNEEEVAEVAGGLNTSQQVDLRSLENLQGHFDALKHAIKGEPYANKIAFKMNEDKPIDARELLYYMAVFDAGKFGRNQHPVALFGRKEGLVREFSKEQKGEAADYRFEILTSRVKDILKLRDELEKKLLEPTYNLGRFKVAGNKKTRVRSKRNKKKPLYFIDEEVDGSLPLGWIMPMLGAFRANVEWNKPKNSFSWKVPLEELLLDVAEQLASTITEIHQSEGSRPEYVGRSATAWRACYSVVENAILRYQLKQRS